MKIHEYQAKELLKKYGIPVPAGGVAFSSNEAKVIVHRIGGFPLVVKAQIHAGSRARGGGVKFSKSMNELTSQVGNMIGMKLVTEQTGAEGKRVRKVLVEQGLTIDRELYLSIMPDRSTAKIVIIASEAGGMDIEKVALESPEKIIKIYIDPLAGIQSFHCRQIAFGLHLSPPVMKQFIPMVTKLYQLFVDCDCLLVEINPLVVAANETIFALDAKMNFDDAALFRHEDIRAYRDFDEEDPFEVEASWFNLHYIKMNGNIGNMVNGAGLAMATLDMIKQAGAEPANFLDAGGGATTEMIENGFSIILSDKNVKAILINIFGGISRCDVLANGIVQAAKKINLKVPLVVRMEGTNVEEGRKILSESDLNLISAVDLKDASEKITQLVTGFS
jgi:succinyl-CoA synthetase beta subunit